MLGREINRVVEDSFGKLFQMSIPAVRYYLLLDIKRKTLDDPLVRRTLDECRAYPPRQRLLNKLRPDGTWPISRQRRLAEEKGPGPPVGWTYTTMLRNLYDLGEYQTSRDEGNVQSSINKILSWQEEDGHIPGPTTNLFHLPQYDGFALRMLLKFGMKGHPGVSRLTDWLLSLQRPDGGWLIPYLEDMRYLPQFKHMRVGDFMNLIEKKVVPEYDPSDYFDVPSCIWTTVMVIRGMTHDPEMAGDRRSRRGAEFVLDNFFRRNHHAAMLRSETNWTKLRYPTYLGSGLCALDILTYMGFGANDERMERPIRWLLSARSGDGLWHQSDRPHPEKDQWITQIALCVLDRYASSLKGRPFGLDAAIEQGLC